MVVFDGVKFNTFCFTHRKEDYDLCDSCFQRMGNEVEYTKIDKPILPHRLLRDPHAVSTSFFYGAFFFMTKLLGRITDSGVLVSKGAPPTGSDEDKTGETRKSLHFGRNCPGWNTDGTFHPVH